MTIMLAHLIKKEILLVLFTIVLFFASYAKRLS